VKSSYRPSLLHELQCDGIPSMQTEACLQSQRDVGPAPGIILKDFHQSYLMIHPTALQGPELQFDPSAEHTPRPVRIEVSQKCSESSADCRVEHAPPIQWTVHVVGDLAISPICIYRRSGRYT
jgi:hypothetical protein